MSTALELALARLAWRRGLPLFAICRGAQALNVARGGTLIQHLPDLDRHVSTHRQNAPGDELTHSVEIDDGIAAREGHGHARARASTRSITRPSTGSVAACARSRARRTASSRASRRPAAGYVLGVQWHAECIAELPEQAALFEGLVAAARSYAHAPERAAA